MARALKPRSFDNGLRDRLGLHRRQGRRLQEACPVECIYEGGRMMYIQPRECIDCGLCLSVCPVDAISAGDDLPERERGFERANAEFFGSAVTGWGSPGGASPAHVSALDHPLVAMRERRR
jgi:NAD-dependent dihydropyrimidine dehydrogenase PreA subunit